MTGSNVEKERNAKTIFASNYIIEKLPILEEINTIILPGQDVPINAVSMRTKTLINEVILHG